MDSLKIWLEPETISIISGGIAAFSTVLIAILTFFVFRIQKKQHRHDQQVALAQFNFSLYEKRMDVVDRVFSFSRDVYRSGRPDIEKAVEFAHDARYAEFLFGADITDFIAEVRKKAINHRYLYDKWEPLRERASNREVLNDEERHEKERSLEAMFEIEGWFLEELKYEQIRKKFGKYVNLQKIVDDLLK